MFKLDPENERHFLEQFKKSAKSGGKYTGTKNSIASFDHNLTESMTHTWVPRPWFMRVNILAYRVRLRIYEQRLATMHDLSPSALDAQYEFVESLRFAVH